MSKVIPKQFSKYGNVYEQVSREGDVVIYKYSKAGIVKGYEVAVIQNRKATEIAGNAVDAGEGLPSASMWGVLGWTYLPTQLEAAKRKFESLVNIKSTTARPELRLSRVNTARKPARVIRRVIKRRPR